MDQNTEIVIAGAGSIGCFVGGMLARGGRRVSLLARPRLVAELAEDGLTLTDLAGLEAGIAPDALRASADPAILAQAGVILVTVKSGATAEMAALIAAQAPPDAVIVSFQNGVENAEILRAGVGGRRVLAGMVPYNVVQLGRGRFHRGTGGDLIIEAGVPGLERLLSVEGLTTLAEADILAVQWGKLLVNLNNALNALSGLPLRRQLATRAWRRLLADQIAEALALVRAAGITPKAATPVPPGLLPFILRLPDPIFALVAARMLKIDPTARSSMWEDLERRRATEIDQLQGAIIRLADKLGRPAPLSRRIAGLIREAEAAGAGSPGLSAAAVRGQAQ